MVLAARVAVTVQLPGNDDDNVPPEIEQPAEPELVTAYEYAPEPEPPEAVSAMDVPYVPDVDVKVTAPCEA